MTFELFMQYCLSGIRVGSIYAIVAIGFNIIYNTTGVINFAQGEFLVMGAMTAIAFHTVMPLVPAIAIAVLITALLGGLLEMTFIKWLKKPEVLRLIIITIGLSIVLREVMSYIFGIENRALPYFSGNESTSINILGAGISPQDLWIIGISIVLVAGLSLFFRFTLLGQAMRACSSNRESARLCGINSALMITLSFVISALIGAVAGCVISPLTQTQYDMGSHLAIKGFTVAIIGGLGNSLAAVAGGVLLGLLEVFSVSIFPNSYRDAITVAVLLIVLVVKPSGIFGKADVSALKDF
ncbi:MAG: branched-chain amino acid ABC transporter permease [Spirochaetales bacterium]|nr:branched-chain amino acid ABC transporter permease [Spirochaetales bacterium]